jgi:hypothetical protein
LGIVYAGQKFVETIRAAAVGYRDHCRRHRDYFVLFRPPILPEDLRFMELSDIDLSSVSPRLRIWLSFVFTVLGGFPMATGVLMITLAATVFGSREPGAFIGAMVGGAASIGMMTAVNFATHSDFKRALLGLAAVWAASSIVYCVEEAQARNVD